MYSSITPRRKRSSFGVCVLTVMPGEHGVVHEAGVPLRPSISTKHKRHEPNGSSESVAHNFGTSTPASAAARMTEVPSATEIFTPSIVTSTAVCSPLRLLGFGAGVPKS
jgi:hypothetical protein